MKRSFLLVITSVLSVLLTTSLYADSKHTVEKGETLYSISRKYGKSVEEISKANNISGNGIKAGQILIIPDDKKVSQTETPKIEPKKDVPKAEISSSADTSTYTVKKGETWYGISRANGTTVAELQKINGADTNTPLKAGQKIKIPTSAGIAAISKNVSEPENKPKTDTKKETKTAESKKEEKKPEMAVTDTRNYSGKKGDASLVWPVKTTEVAYLKGKVSGVTLGASNDEDVKSIREGNVIFAGSYRGFGNVVFIQSKTGHIYAYTGLGKVAVSKGEYHTAGSKLGTAGIDSYSQKSQITLMVFQNGNPIDPAKAPRG